MPDRVAPADDAVVVELLVALAEQVAVLGPEAMVLQRAGRDDQELVHLDGVGNYAVAFTWADGHSTGIYSFRLLRKLCPCDACGGEKR